jgi:hypothetical protein
MRGNDGDVTQPRRQQRVEQQQRIEWIQPLLGLEWQWRGIDDRRVEQRELGIERR